MTYKISSDCSRHASEAASRVRDLGVRAATLASDIDTLHRAILSVRDEPVCRAGFHRNAAVGLARQIRDELRDTADHLEGTAAAAQLGVCAVPWGACPVHGHTLTSSGRKAWCREPGCGRTWPNDRVGLPCVEPARWTVTGQHGASMVMCDGHALDARKRLEGARVELREEFV